MPDTDALKSAEDAVRDGRNWHYVSPPGTFGGFMYDGPMGDYGSMSELAAAIIARRDAEVAALVEAAQWEDMCVNCAHGEAYHTGFGATACALCEFACPEFRPKQMLRAALAPFTKEAGQ